MPVTTLKTLEERREELCMERPRLVEDLFT